MPASISNVTVIAGGAAVVSTGPMTSTPWLLVALAVLAGGVLARRAWVAMSLLRLRRLRSAGRTAPLGDELDDLQRALGTRAEIRLVAGLRQPVTFGIRWPVVLLPDSLLEHPDQIQRVVLCHELLHVQRNDWGWAFGEELVRVLFWFHPAVWWAVSRVQLAREEVVDEQVVRITGARRTYIEALMAFAEASPIAPAAAFSRRRHLFRRILLISKRTVDLVEAAAAVGRRDGGGPHRRQPVRRGGISAVAGAGGHQTSGRARAVRASRSDGGDTAPSAEIHRRRRTATTPAATTAAAGIPS